MSEGSLNKSAANVQEMFARVAPRYDLLNHLLSGSLDRLWRRRCAAALDLPAGAKALDLCCGTGDQAAAIQRRGEATVVAADFCLPMVHLARRKFSRWRTAHPHLLSGDTLSLPFADDSFDAVTVSFGLRNLADLDAGLAEIQRVLRPGGEAAFLEFALPKPVLLRKAYLLYFERLLPAIGRLVSPNPSAYRYLPDSVLEFPQRRAFLDRMAEEGFIELGWDDLSAGIVCLYTGVAAK